MRFRCSFSTMPATYNTPRCFEVAVKESLISPAMSPTDASRDFLRYWRMASRRLLANAFICFSISFNTESSITHTHTHTHTHTPYCINRANTERLLCQELFCRMMRHK